MSSGGARSGRLSKARSQSSGIARPQQHPQPGLNPSIKHAEALLREQKQRHLPDARARRRHARHPRALTRRARDRDHLVGRGRLRRARRDGVGRPRGPGAHASPVPPRAQPPARPAGQRRDGRGAGQGAQGDRPPARRLSVSGGPRDGDAGGPPAAATGDRWVFGMSRSKLWGWRRSCPQTPG